MWSLTSGLPSWFEGGSGSLSYLRCRSTAARSFRSRGYSHPGSNLPCLMSNGGYAGRRSFWSCSTSASSIRRQFGRSGRGY